MTEKSSVYSMSMSFSTSSFSIMLKNGAASVISSSDTVGGGGAFIRGGRLNKGAFIDGFYLLRGAFIQRHYVN